MNPDFSRSVEAITPFPHLSTPELVDETLGAATLAWLRDRAPWRLRVEDFYEQHEIDLLDVSLPVDVAPIADKQFLEGIRRGLEDRLPHEAPLHLVDVSAHRLTKGQTIRIHNDHIGGEETHRLLLHLNEGWSPDQGGLLMLFSQDRPEALTNVILPKHRGGFGFRISDDSHHAVSTIRNGERFTVVYTFRQLS
ncbi:2OG-Fe(II) oxygenase [Myxococcus sp. AM001]|nr:2OG-Fe(II) oxygenase [Myxococcus sp. AM001]